jgi:peroxiredoxin-like protein
VSTHVINIAWKRTTKDFDYKTYNRAHTVHFSGGSTTEVSAAPEYLGEPSLANPEEMLVAAISSCFMLTFLAVAATKNITIDSYIDKATGELTKNTDGKMSITEVTLHPEITFPPNQTPTTTVLRQLLEKAHANCFITNSVKTVVHIKPVLSEIEITIH